MGHDPRTPPLLPRGMVDSVVFGRAEVDDARPLRCRLVVQRLSRWSVGRARQEDKVNATNCVLLDARRSACMSDRRYTKLVIHKHAYLASLERAASALVSCVS